MQLLFFVRRYCAKLLYELEFHAAPDVTQLRRRYVELLGDALKIEPSPTDYLADIDAGFYVTVLPPRLGVRGADDDLPARGVRQRLVPAAARPARSCASCGRSARSRPRTSC